MKLKNIKTVHDVNIILIKRYKKMLKKTPKNRDLKMCKILLKSDFPIDKTSRWIGFIQRGLIDGNLTTVQAERDFSRPLFHKAYKEMGYEIPESVTV